MEDKTRLLLVTRPHATMDSLAAALVIADILKTKEKTVTLITPGYTSWPEPLQSNTLPEQHIHGFRSLRIHLPIKDTPLEQFSYDIRDQQLYIELLPKTGTWPQQAVGVETSAVRFDGVIAINISQQSLVNSLVIQEPEWMQNLPSLHITNDPEAEPWAAQTISCLQTPSLCEELYAWLKSSATSLSPELIHNLMVGLIAATDGFRHPRVQSRTLQTASELVERGADRQMIMNRLWRIHSVPTLNLWGRAFMRLTLHPSLALATSVITEHDFLQTRATHEALPGLGTHLLDRLPETQLVLLLSAWNNRQQATLFTRAPLQADLIARWFHGQGDRSQAQWTIEGEDLLVAQNTILTVLERELPRLLSSR